MISDSRKFVFIHIPKTGGSSIAHCLQKYSTDPVTMVGNNVQILCNEINNVCTYYKHASLQQHIDIHGDKLNDYLKFTVVRNPWERLLSLWYWGDGDFNKRGFINKIKSQSIVSPGESAWAPMADYIYEGNKLLVDKIIRFENLDSEFREVMKEFSINVRLPHINTTEHKHYTEYYDNDTKAVVEQYYKRDLELFDYTFGD